MSEQKPPEKTSVDIVVDYLMHNHPKVLDAEFAKVISKAQNNFCHAVVNAFDFGDVNDSADLDYEPFDGGTDYYKKRYTEQRP